MSAIILLVIAVLVLAGVVNRIAFAAREAKAAPAAQMPAVRSDASECLERVTTEKGKMEIVAASYDALHVRSHRLHIFQDGSTLTYRRGQWVECKATCAQVVLLELWEAKIIGDPLGLYPALSSQRVTSLCGDLSGLITPGEAITFPDGSALEYDAAAGYWVLP